MSRDSYWEGVKRPFLTDENARRKWEQLLPDEDFSVLDEFHPRRKLQILRWLALRERENQNMEAVQSLIQTAREDYRDIGIAEQLHGFTYPWAKDREEEEARAEKDAREYVEWLSS